MANPEHLAKLKEGAKAWNQWRRENPDAKVDLSDANLSGVTLFEVNFEGATLVRANFIFDSWGNAEMTAPRLLIL